MKSNPHNLTESGSGTIDSLYSKGGLIAFLENHNLRLSKALGQNFLINRKVMETILGKMDYPKSGWVIEIGPGLGHLTWTLMQRGLSVCAIEKDRTLIPLLQELVREIDPQMKRLHLMEANAEEVDYVQLTQNFPAGHVIGNLPYYAVVPIVFRLAYSGVNWKSLGFMVQKEVGERIATGPGSKDYGRLSVVLNYLYRIRKMKNIQPGSFFPAPKVESVFLQFTPKEGVDLEFAQLYLERVVKMGFAHRRKKLRGQLKGSIIQRRVLDEETLQQLEKRFNLEQRAEEWPLEIWVEFAKAIQSMATRE